MRLFSRNFAAALLAGTALAGFVAQSAFAQEAKTETPAVEDQATDTRTPAQSPTRGEPVKVGKFYLNSGASVSRVYDDNVFATNTGKTSDWSTVYSGFARLESDFDRHELNIYAGGDTSRYSSQKNEDYTDYFAGFDGKVDITDSHALFGGAEYERSHEARTSADDVNGIKPTIYSDERAFGGYTGKFDNTSVRLGGTADIMNFDDVASSNGIINNDDRDRNMYELGLRVSQQIVQGFELFGQGVLDDRVYKAAKDDNGYDRDSSGYRLGGGAAVRLSGDVYAEGFGGAMSQNYDDPRFETVTTPYFGGSLSAPLSNDTLIRASLSRTINETTVSGASSSVSTSAGFTLYSNLTDDLESTVYLGLIKDKFQDIQRTDNIKQAGASLRYWLLPWVYLEGGYDISVRTATSQTTTMRTTCLPSPSEPNWRPLATNIVMRPASRSRSTVSMPVSRAFTISSGTTRTARATTTGRRIPNMPPGLAAAGPMSGTDGVFTAIITPVRKWNTTASPTAGTSIRCRPGVLTAEA